MITSHEPNVSLNGRYTVIETCKILGICRNTLVKYTNMGAIRYGMRRSGPQKFYTGREIMRVWRSQV